MEIIQKFIIENLDLLLASDNRIQAIKLKKKDFFLHNRLSASFSLKDIAFETIRYVIRLHNIRSEKELRRIISKSFLLREYLTENQIEGFLGLINPIKISVLSPSDLGKLGQREFIETKEQELIKKVTAKLEQENEEKIRHAMDEINKEREHLEELKKSAEQKLEAVTNIESILDSYSESTNPDPLEKEEEKKEIKQYVTWWQKIGLLGDPFPNKLGLDFIPISKYEQVIVFTKIFKNYLQTIAEVPESFYGKTILISGQFGSGKTTFMAYISYRLAEHKIIPFNLVLDAVGDIDSLRQSFYSEIFSQIGRALKQRGLVDPRPMGLSADKTTIADLLSYLSEEADIDGFSIMIDGLHKAESTIDTALEFVKQLQNFHEYLNNKGVNTSIFIAGSPLWQRKITQNPAFSGSFYRMDEIPQLTFDDAYELLQKRFNAFSDPSIPVFFEKSTVRFAYDCVKAESGFITFRDFIDYILPKLQKGDLKELGISISIDLEDAQKIDKMLLSSTIKDSYHLFKKMTLNQRRLKRSCSIILRAIYKKTCLTEGEQLFIDNKRAAYILNKAHLIRRLKTSKGTGWALSSDLIAVLDTMNDDGYPPEIVFQTFALDLRTKQISKTDDDPLINQAQNYLAKWESEWPEIVLPLKAFIEKTSKVVNVLPSERKEEICADCKNALLDLIDCSQVIMKSSQKPEDWLRSTWLDIPILPTIIPLLRQDSLSDTEPIEYYQRFRQSASVLLEKIGQLLNAQNVVSLITSKNRKLELKLLFDAATLLEGGEIEKALDIINSNLEDRIRAIFHLVFSMRFGPDYSKYLPAQTQTRIAQLGDKGPSQLKRTLDKNLFYHMSRSEYAEVVNNKKYWTLLFEKIFQPRTREEVFNAFQLTFALDDRNAHRDRKDYFRERKNSIRQAIINADWLYDSLRNAINVVLNPVVFDSKLTNKDRFTKISFLNEGDSSTAYTWKIESEHGKDIVNRLLRAERILNVMDDTSVVSIFNGSFAEVFIVIVLMIKCGYLDVESISDGNMFIRLTPKPKAS